MEENSDLFSGHTDKDTEKDHFKYLSYMETSLHRSFSNTFSQWLYPQCSQHWGLCKRVEGSSRGYLGHQSLSK